MVGNEASKLGKGRSKPGSGRLNGETEVSGAADCAMADCEGVDGADGTPMLSGERDGVPVKDATSAGKPSGMPEPAKRAMSASLGALSIDGSEGTDGAGTPNWGCRISAPGMAAGYGLE
jgi:hypothetical protein